jgi:hypothetical protein
MDSFEAIVAIIAHSLPIPLGLGAGPVHAHALQHAASLSQSYPPRHLRSILLGLGRHLPTDALRHAYAVLRGEPENGMGYVGG